MNKITSFIDYIDQLLDLAERNDIFCLTSRAFNEFATEVRGVMSKGKPMYAGVLTMNCNCPACGETMEYENNYCPECGQRLKWEVEIIEQDNKL